MAITGTPLGKPAGFATKTALGLLLVGMLALAACTTTAHVASDYDKSTEFSKFHKFALVVRPHPSMHSSPLVEQRTYDAIRQELIAKGFTYVADLPQADFAVDFSVGAQDRLDVSSYPQYVGPFGPAGWSNQVDVHQYQEGTLAIDVFDLQTHRAVWHGTATKELSQSEIEHSEQPIREAVTSVLARFPT